MTTLTPEELQNARDSRQLQFEGSLFSKRRISEVADEFTRLEVQIAAILLAFSGTFVESLSAEPSRLVKGVFVSMVLALMLSLGLGLLHLKRKEKFWHESLSVRGRRVDAWQKVVKGKEPISYAEGVHAGTKSESATLISNSPTWTWVLQSIALGIAVGMMFLLVLIFLF